MTSVLKEFSIYWARPKPPNKHTKLNVMHIMIEDWRGQVEQRRKWLGPPGKRTVKKGFKEQIDLEIVFTKKTGSEIKIHYKELYSDN